MRSIGTGDCRLVSWLGNLGAYVLMGKELGNQVVCKAHRPIYLVLLYEEFLVKDGTSGKDEYGFPKMR
jgi:hypothetical protein